MQVVANFKWDCGRNGDVEGVFICDKREVERLIGKQVNLGDVLGKHSDVNGTIDKEDLTIVSENPLVVQTLLSIFPTGYISGINPIDYYEDQEGATLLSPEEHAEVEPPCETVLILKKEYDELLDSDRILNHLHANGVDNWEGYSIPGGDEDEEEEDEI